jgi:hypothetical protein
MLKNLLFCLSTVLLLGQFSVQAQHRSCGTMSNLERLEKLYPGTKAQLAATNEIIKSQQKQNKQNLRTGAALITIPVVVHVVYKTTAQNISDAQIQSQLASLNEDYNKLNADTANIPAAFKPLLGNAQIQFTLAKRDPNGDPTTGITRTATTVNRFSDDDAIKYTSQGGHDIWNRDKYLNIWVGNLGNALLGYAQFPGSGPVNADGVVIGYTCFGRTGTAAAPFHKGRTATHEVGHWLGLYHIWGDEPACAQDDDVADTPLQKDANFDCPTYPLLTGGGESCSGTTGALFMNYMDYVDDACMNMFTTGQRNRMQSALNVSRPALATSDGLTPVVVLPLDASVFRVLSPLNSTCYNTITPKIILKNSGSTPLTSATISFKLDNGTFQTYQWTGNLASRATTQITLPVITVTAGQHIYQISTSLPNGQTDNDLTNDSQIINFIVVQQPTGQSLPLVESFEGTVFPPAGWTRTNEDNDLTWTQTNQAKKDGNKSVFMKNWDYYYIGEKDELILPALNLTTQSGPQLNFQVAYSPTSFSFPSDSLQVLASTDCGETFISIYKKTGQALATTAAASANEFTPTTAQWRMETVSLANFSANSSVILKFRSINRYDNNLYLDDVKVTGALGLKAEAFNEKLVLFPNPANGLITLKHPEYKQLEIIVTNALGQEIMRKSSKGITETVLNLEEKPAGMYMVKVMTGTRIFVQKLIMAK